MPAVFFESGLSPKRKWHVTKSWIENGSMGKPMEIVVSGPRGCPHDDGDVAFEWTTFRMYDDDGVLYYEGRMNQYEVHLSRVDEKKEGQ